MIIYTLITCAVLAYVYYYVTYLAKYRRLVNLIPGPPMLPIIGDSIVMFQASKAEIFDIIMARSKQYGRINKAWYGQVALININHPDDIQTIMSNTKYNNKGMIYILFEPWLKDGLLISKDQKWQERRKILTPTFHFNILNNFLAVLVEESNRMIESLKNMNNRTIEDLALFTSHHTLNIICETSMGISLQNVSEEEQLEYRQTVHKWGEIMLYRLLRPWIYTHILYMMTPTYWKEVKYVKILHRFTEKIIKERKQYHQATGGRYLNFENDAGTDKTIRGRKKRLAMLDFLIAESNNNRMSDLDIREEVDTFMFEGHDTVAIALNYTILLLADHKNVQDRARDEVNAVMQENGGELTMTALQNLEYLERCLKETMRLYPSVFYISRYLQTDATLDSYVVPAGTEVHLDIFGVHRNPEFWPNPEEFDPDRFLPELVKNRHPFAYVPFSAGSRNCIGQRFAMMELKVVIASLLHNFRLEPIDKMKDVRFIMDMLLRSKYPLRVKFVPLSDA